MENKNTCFCCEAPKLIFPCSGASDTGEIADRAARKLARKGQGRMSCLAGIGGRVTEIIGATQTASKILVIDGCSSDCAKKTLEQAGFKKIKHLRISDIGMEKGNSPVTEERINKVVVEGNKALMSQ
ncbi:MAG: putative zinc-binding protein [Deltaproteobacteria bacterium]|nr:putative zinc-binding protein [Deltaproteobacteria bacterium]